MSDPNLTHCILIQTHDYGTKFDATTRRRDDGDFGETLPRTLNYTFLLRNEHIPFTNAGRNSVLRTPKQVCSCMMERARGERP